MKRSVISLTALFGILIAALVAAIFYIRSGDKEEEIASLPNDQANLQEKGGEKKHEAFDSNRQKGDLDNVNNDEMKKAQASQKDSANGDFNQPAGQDLEKPDSAAMKEAVQQQMAVLFDDLFKELSLPPDQQQKLQGHLSKSMQSQAELAPLMLDPNTPVEEVLKRQEKLLQAQSAELGSILSAKDQEVVKKYQENLPKKMQTKQLMGIVEQLGVSGADKENAQRIIERAIEKTETQKASAKISKEEILELRGKFAGKNAGGEEFMKANMAAGAEKANNLLKNLKELPKEQYEKIKEQIEMSMKMMEQKANAPRPSGQP